MKKFKLIHGKKEFGTMSFNGFFIFELRGDIDLKEWEKFGIIPVDEKTRKCESVDLFNYINSRLPIHLRNADKEEKIEYIARSGLKVASDNFEFVSEGL
ncbi:MAG: hypothetical protein ABIE14_04515 [Patescibacteria group bacterium]